MARVSPGGPQWSSPSPSLSGWKEGALLGFKVFGFGNVIFDTLGMDPRALLEAGDPRAKTAG